MASGPPLVSAVRLSSRVSSIELGPVEVDDYWSKLSAGGSEIQCGWLKDKFGLSWQIVPARLPELIKHPKAMQAMMGMKKLNIAELERAAQS